jgi:Enoyl-CoA hydratase (EC 4.2.1.17)
VTQSRLERDGGVARLVLNRPESRNALSSEVSDGIVEAVRELEGGDSRVVVVEGEGKAFCAGGDISTMIEHSQGDESMDHLVRWIIQEVGRAVKAVSECEFPTVAKIDGPAFGAGGSLALACDIQLLSETAGIGFGFRQVGLAVDAGTSYLLPQYVGRNVARELVYTGEIVSGDRATSLGLANHVFDAETFEQESEALIARIAEGPTVGLRTSKRLLRHNASATIDEAIDHEAAAQAAVFDSADHHEGITAFEQSRDPEFQGE